MTDYTYSTGNPIGSTDVRDGVDNLKSFDVMLNSTDDTYQDRLGNTVPTAAGAIKRLGPVLTAWTFTTGGTLNYPNEAALNPADGNFYGWTGAFPKVVAPGTDPTVVYGYVPRTDVVLRWEITQQLSDAVSEIETIKLGAEAARDSAMIVGNLYPDTATGLAAVGESAYFSVASTASDNIIVLYRNVSGVAVEIGRYPSSAFISNSLDSVGYNESGYAWALVDSQNKIAFAVRNDGSVEIGNQVDVENTLALVSDFAPSAALIDAYFEEYGTHSGYAWALVDSADNMIICVRKDGKLEVAGYYIARQADLNALNTRIYGSSNGKSIVAWGDSLTEGSGGTPYPQQLSSLLNVPVINEGFGGQTTKKIIARQGGASALVTVSGNSIPASGSVNVTLDVSLLSYTSSSTISIKGCLNGVLGTLTKDTSNNYSFARATSGSAVITPPNTAFVVTKSTRNTAGLQLDYGINLFWCGSNDVGVSTIVDVPTLIDQAVAHLKTSEKRFVILGPINNSAYTSATQAYVDMRAATNQLKAKYPAHFIDIQEILLYNYNSGIPQDVTDFGNKVIPSSLRADAIHLNSAGYAVVANAVKSFIDMKGWLS